MTDRTDLAAMPASPRTGDILTATPAAHEMWKHLVDIGAGSDTATLVRLALQEARAEAAQQAAPLDGWTPEDAAFAEDAIDRAIPDADFGEVARSEVIRSIFRALREQGYTVVPAQARPADAALPWEHAYESGVQSAACVTCGFVGSYAHTEEFYRKWVFPALAQQPTAAEGA